MDIANLLNPASNPSPVHPASLTHRSSHRVAKPRLYLSKSKLCPSWLYLVMPAWPQDMNTVHGHGYQLTTLSGSTTLNPGEQIVYYSADIAGDTWGYLTTYSYPSASADAHVSWKVEPFIPMIQWDGLNTDIISFVKARIPSDEVVYNRLGIPEAKRGRGLQHAMPDPPRGGEPRCSMSTLIHLALLSTPRKCLLGYEIVAILMGHFRYFRTTDQDWKLVLYRALRAQSWFSSLPSPADLPPAERIWYIDYSQIQPKSLPVGNYMWRSGDKKRVKQCA